MNNNKLNLRNINQASDYKMPTGYHTKDADKFYVRRENDGRYVLQHIRYIPSLAVLSVCHRKFNCTTVQALVSYLSFTSCVPFFIRRN